MLPHELHRYVTAASLVILVALTSAAFASRQIDWDYDELEVSASNVSVSDSCDAIVNFCIHRDTFPCLKEGKCIARDRVCNYVSDCADGSDEYRCPTMCSLQDIAKHAIGTHCGWSQENASAKELQWLVMAAYETISGVRVSPNVDSLGHSCGKFFALADFSFDGC